MCRRAIGVLLVIWLSVSGCGSLLGTTAVAPQTPMSVPPVPSATPDAVLLRVRGEVRLQQAITGWVTPASFGDYLWRGDVIVTGQNAQAEAVCSDGESVHVLSSQSVIITCGGIPDPVYQRVIVRIHSRQIEALPVNRFGPPESGNVPVVLSPRNTWLTEGRPEIRWRAVEGADDYQVTVLGPKGELWRAAVQETELPYPRAQPALETGGSYLIQVTAEMGPAEQSQPSKEVLVTVLSAADAGRVHQFEAHVEALGLAAESARFLLAAYYADQKLYDAATVELVSLAKETCSPLVHRLLADVYLAVGLDGEASQSYQEAYRLAQGQGDWLVLAEVEVGLGHIAYAAKDFENALSHYQAALILYRKLGLESDAETVTKFVANTEARFPTPTP